MCSFPKIGWWTLESALSLSCKLSGELGGTLGLSHGEKNTFEFTSFFPWETRISILTCYLDTETALHLRWPADVWPAHPHLCSGVSFLVSAEWRLPVKVSSLFILGSVQADRERSPVWSVPGVLIKSRKDRASASIVKSYLQSTKHLFSTYLTK